MAELPKLPWQTEKEFYDLHATILFSQFEFYHTALVGNSAEEFLQYIITKARINKESRILDMGCGSGYLVHQLNKVGYACGISTSENCISYCLKKYPESRFEVGSMEDFEMKNLTHILSLESIGYSNVKKTFQNAFSNLIPGGLFYIKDWCRYKHEYREQTKNRKAFQHYWKYKPKTVAKMVQIATKTGFNLIEYHDLTDLINVSFFNETVPLNQSVFTLPFPDENFQVAAEFLFQKPQFL